jgi:hypothetical protein
MHVSFPPRELQQSLCWKGNMLASSQMHQIWTDGRKTWYWHVAREFNLSLHGRICKSGYGRMRKCGLFLLKYQNSMWSRCFPFLTNKPPHLFSFFVSWHLGYFHLQLGTSSVATSLQEIGESTLSLFLVKSYTTMLCFENGGFPVLEWHWCYVMDLETGRQRSIVSWWAVEAAWLQVSVRLYLVFTAAEGYFECRVYCTVRWWWDFCLMVTPVGIKKRN